MKISIITACFNSEKTIEKTINSILIQDYGNIEYIVIDGESTDSTLSILNKYKNSISNVTSEKDKGIYDALNKGIRLATGDIIGFLHSDDYYPNKQIISNAIKLFKSDNKLNIVFGDAAFLNKDERIGRYNSGKNFNFDIGIMPPHPSVFIKKKCYDKYGQFNTDYKIASDYDFLFRLIELNNVKYMYSKDILVYMNPGGASNKNIISRINLNKEIYKIHKSHNSSITFLNLLRKIPIRFKEILFQ